MPIQWGAESSVGPVGGRAVAGLVDLALLLQAAGLTPLTGSSLNAARDNTQWVREGVCGWVGVCECVPVRPERGGGAAVWSAVAGEAGCGGRGLERTPLGLPLDPPALTAG